MVTLYCRRREAKSCSVTCAMTSIQLSKRYSRLLSKNLQLSIYDVRVHVCKFRLVFLQMYAVCCMCVCVACGPSTMCRNLNLFTPPASKSLDMGYLHSEMRNRFRFRGSFQAPLFPVTFKSKSISPAPVVLLLG